MTGLEAAFLGACTVATWLGALALLRLGDPLSKLHAVAFLDCAAGPFAVAAILAHDGASFRAAKVLVLAIAAIEMSAALSHATARALHRRERTQKTGDA